MRRLGWIRESLGLLGALVALCAFFAWRVPTFLTAPTLLTIANQIPEATVIAVGMTLVLLIGGIDLSVGSILGLSGATLGLALLRWHLPLPLAAVLALVMGALGGAINGLVTVPLRVPAFIVTLGMLEVARGATYLLTDSRTQYIGKPIERLAAPGPLGLTLPAVLALVLVVVGQLVLSKTVFGRNLLATGGNEQTAYLSGIPTARLKMMVYTLCGALAGLAGLFNTARLASADPNAGTGAELSAIAAVVIGGTSLLGGRGSVVGSFLGVLVIAVLGNGLAQLGTQEPTKRLITGAVIVLAVVADLWRARKERTQ